MVDNENNWIYNFVFNINKIYICIGNLHNNFIERPSRNRLVHLTLLLWSINVVRRNNGQGRSILRRMKTRY